VALGDLWEHEADEGLLSMAVESLGVTQEALDKAGKDA
jgi:hypothetical protein